MSWVDVMGWIAAVVGAFYALPQTLRVIRAGSTAGVSLRTWQFQVAASIGWTLHGLTTGQPSVQWANATILVSGAVVLWRIMRDRALSLVVWLPTILAGAFLLWMDQFFGAAVFGIAVIIPQAVSILIQFHGLLHAVDYSGVSWIFMAFAIFTQILWFGYAIPRHEVAVIICGVVTSVLQGACLVLYAMRRAGWTPASVREAQRSAPVAEQQAVELQAVEVHEVEVHGADRS